MKEWLKNAVFYEIYPQTFKDTNGDGIGDFAGICEKLDYIKDMGFTAIWMNPCFKSPFGDAGYDVEDYYLAAPRYGTNEDLKHLFDEAHKRDMHVILDLVPGHTAVTCKWFTESMKPERNEYSDRYIWTDSIWKDCAQFDEISGSLRGISARNGSCAVNFYSTQPALNYGFAKITEAWQCAPDSEAALATRAEMLNIIRFWLGLGCDGFRVDMAGSLVKADEGQKETIKLWQDILGKVNKEFPEAAFVSEWGEPDRALEAGFDMDFLLHFGPSHYVDLFRTITPSACAEIPYFTEKGGGKLTEFFEYYTMCLEKTAGKGYICIPSGNHDMPRLSQRLSDAENRLAFAFLLAMPGVPFIYYGDEIGMRNLDGITSVEGGYDRTPARTPMQWDSSVNCGFSSASPDMLYTPVDPSEDRPTVAAQLADSSSLLHEVRNLIQIRRTNEALQESSAFTLLSAPDGYPLVFLRGEEKGGILVAINPLDKVCSFKTDLSPSETIYSINGKATVSGGVMTLPPCSASYLKL